MRRLAHRVVLMGCLVASAAAAPQQARPEGRPSDVAAAVASLEFHSDFWLNLHHILYAAAWDRPPVVTGPARLAGPSVARSDALDPNEAREWDAAVDVYAASYRRRDLLFDDGMAAIKAALGRAGDRLGGTEVPADLRQALERAAPIYRRHWWAEDDRANRAWIADVLIRVGALAPDVTPRLARLFRTPWPTTPVRVDAVRVGNRQGAYTSIGPDWIVASTSSPSAQEWAAAEILFHESSHLLIRPVMLALDQAAARAHVSLPPVLWHVVLFAVTGEVTKQALAARGVAYEPYLEKTGLFDRAWPTLRQPIAAAVPDFVAGRATLEEMATRLVAAIGGRARE